MVPRTVLGLLVLGVGFLVVHGDIMLTSTKTAYNDSLTEADREIIDNFHYLFVPSTCEPIYINVILRHGTRNPNDGDIEDLNALLTKIRGHVQNPAFAALNDWTPPYIVGKQSELVATGYAEHRQLGQRYGRRFADLLSHDDDKSFFTSSKQRCIDSCQSFQFGLGSVLGETIEEKCEIRNDLVRFYDDCPYLEVSVEENKDVMTEYDAFGDGPDMTSLVNNVTQLLDFDNGITLTKEELELIYTILGFDIAINRSSLFEGIMTEEQLEIMAFWNDIKYYWDKSYSYSINSEVACTLLSDVFKRIDDAILANDAHLSSHKAFFQFGHTSTIMRLAALLKLNEGTYPLRHDNFRKDREFKTSYDNPFSANMAFTAYKCDTSSPIPSSDRDKAPPGVVWPDQVSDYMIQLLYKEIPARFPFSSYHLVPLNDVVSVYGRYIDQCNIDSICRKCYENSATSFSFHGSHITISLIVLYLFSDSLVDV